MKKIILIILTLLLIPFFIITIKDIDREEVNPTLTYNLTTTDSTYTDLNGHTLQEVFEDGQLLSNPNFIDTNSDGLADDWFKASDIYAAIDENGQYIGADVGGVQWFLFSKVNLQLHKYYILYDVYANSNGFQFYDLSSSSRSPVVYGTGIKSYIAISSLTGEYSFPVIYLNNTGDYLQLRCVKMYSMTSLGIDTLTVEQMDAWHTTWYTIYQTYHTTYTTLTLGTATATTYTSLQQLIIDNADKDFKLYRDDVADETHYRLTQESDYISITNDDDLEIIRINDDDTFESSLQVDDTTDYKLVGYNVTSYIDGSFDNTILAFVWIIPILLIGGFFFVIFSHRKED